MKSRRVQFEGKVFWDFETRKASSELSKVDTDIGDSFEAVQCLQREER